MRHRTLRTILLCSAVVICVAVGTAVGVRLRREAAGDTTTAIVAAPAPGTATAEGAPAPAVVDPAAPAIAPDPAAAAEGPNDVAGEAEDELAGEQAPPEGEERPPPRQNPPAIPELEFEPGAFDPPVFLPPAGGNGNRNQPPPPAAPLDIAAGRLGPGPIYEANPRDCGPNAATRTSTFWTISIRQAPRSAPYEVLASARAGNGRGAASVHRQPGAEFTYDIGYSFPRNSVNAPTPISITVTVIDSHGNMRTETFGGQPGMGHQLYPWDHCR